ITNEHSKIAPPLPALTSYNLRMLTTRIRLTIIILSALIIVWMRPWNITGQSVQPAAGVRYSQIAPDDMKEWLTYLASDELQARRVFTEGYGLAAQYISERLKQWGVKPLGASGTFLQPMKVSGYKVTRNSSVTVEVNGTKRTFKHGDHVTFNANSGGKQTLTFDGVEFLGYGQAADLAGRNVRGKLVVTVPNLASAANAAGGGRGAGGGAIHAGAAAVISLTATPTPTPTESAVNAVAEAVTQAQTSLNQANAAVQQAQQGLRGGRGGFPAGGRGGGGGRGALPAADITTAQRVDAVVAPN